MVKVTELGYLGFTVTDADAWREYAANIVGWEVWDDGETDRSFQVMSDTIKEELERVFNPEFLNRLDDIIVFHPLTKEHISKIVTILLHEVQRRLGDEVRLSPAAIEFLVDKGYDPSFGARPLKRTIQKYIEDPLSEKILLGELGRGDEIEVELGPDGDKLVFSALTGSQA